MIPVTRKKGQRVQRISTKKRKVVRRKKKHKVVGRKFTTTKKVRKHMRLKYDKTIETFYTCYFDPWTNSFSKES